MATTDEMMTDEELEPIAVKTVVSDAGTWAKKLAITVGSADVGKVYDGIVTELSRGLNVPGFRPGKVPKDYALKRFGDEIKKQAKAQIVARALRSSLETEKLDTVGTPDVEIEKVELQPGKDLSFDAIVEVRPTFELGTYKGVPIEQEETEIFPEEVDQEVEGIAFRLATEGDAPADATLQDKDKALGVLRYLIDGNEVKREDDAHLLLVRGHTVGVYAHVGIDFLKGAKVGEKRTLEEALSQGFPMPEHRGKKATLEFELKSIRRPVLPPLDDEFAKKVGAESVQSLKDKIGERIRENLAEESKKKVRQTLIDKLIDETKFELPERLRKRFSAQLAENSEQMMVQMGVSREQLGLNEQEFHERALKNAEKEIRQYFVLEELCRKENIDVGEDELDEELVRQARSRNVRAADLYDQMNSQDPGLRQFKADLRHRKALEFLVQQAEVKVVPRKKAEACEHDAHGHGHDHGHDHGHSH